jgi:hypothetical protein
MTSRFDTHRNAGAKESHPARKKLDHLTPKSLLSNTLSRTAGNLGDKFPQLHERTHPRVDPVLTNPKVTETAQ